VEAIRVHETGGPEVMRLETVPTPEPGQGQALVRTEAIGVNFVDVYNRVGLYKNPLPFTPGSEGAGIVEKVGPGVSEVKVGDRVGWVAVDGSYATHVVAPAQKLIPLPEGVSTHDAAAVLLQGLTAHYLATSTYPLKPDESCLVHASAGGVGRLLCQIAKLRGARVIGTAGSPEKATIAREAGADEVILYREQDFVAETRRLTGGSGVQVVYDMVGKDTFDGSLSSLARRGCLVLVGQSSGPVPPMDPRVLNTKGSLYLTRPSLRDYTVTRDELLGRAKDVLTWLSEGKLRLRVDRTYPLAEAAEAHRALEGRQTAGKVLMIP
jgi:NADPH:quinone reductase